MRKSLVVLLLLCTAPGLLYAQKYIGRALQMTLIASTPVEDIDPVHNEVAGVLDASSGNVVFEVLIKGFKFDKALMQEHFNENYMESDRYPKAVFKGKIADPGKINFTKNGHYMIQVTGALSIHGVTKNVSIPASVNVDGENLKVQAAFKVKPEDYNIKIPALVRNKVAKEVNVALTGLLLEK